MKILAEDLCNHFLTWRRKPQNNPVRWYTLLTPVRGKSCQTNNICFVFHKRFLLWKNTSQQWSFNNIDRNTILILSNLHYNFYSAMRKFQRQEEWKLAETVASDMLYWNSWNYWQILNSSYITDDVGPYGRKISFHI